MIFPCPNRITCPGTDDPFANLTSEDPDRLQWVSNKVVISDPRMGGPWITNTCFGDAVSYISQADADEQAKFVADLCVPCLTDTCGFPPSPPPPPGGGDGGDTWFYNSGQSCTFTCADGNQFVYSANAGYFSGPTQAAADYKAHTYACFVGAKQRVCLGSLPASACVGTAYSQTVGIYPNNGGTLILVSGTLPPGLSFANNVLSGTPTTLGTYTFQVKVTDSRGSYMFKTFTIRVCEVEEPDELEDGFAGELYLHELTGDSQGIPIAWRVSEGTLPTGLILDATTGEIYGTPTVPGDYTFTVCMTTI
jgi:hypothetical protein